MSGHAIFHTGIVRSECTRVARAYLPRRFPAVGVLGCLHAWPWRPPAGAGRRMRSGDACPRLGASGPVSFTPFVQLRGNLAVGPLLNDICRRVSVGVVGAPVCVVGVRDSGSGPLLGRLGRVVRYPWPALCVAPEPSALPVHGVRMATHAARLAGAFWLCHSHLDAQPPALPRPYSSCCSFSCSWRWSPCCGAVLPAAPYRSAYGRCGTRSRRRGMRVVQHRHRPCMRRSGWLCRGPSRPRRRPASDRARRLWPACAVAGLCAPLRHGRVVRHSKRSGTRSTNILLTYNPISVRYWNM